MNQHYGPAFFKYALVIHWRVELHCEIGCRFLLFPRIWCYIVFFREVQTVFQVILTRTLLSFTWFLTWFLKWERKGKSSGQSLGHRPGDGLSVSLVCGLWGEHVKIGELKWKTPGLGRVNVHHFSKWRTVSKVYDTVAWNFAESWI